MFEGSFEDIMEGLISIEKDTSIPKNVRIKIKNAISILTDVQELNIDIKIDRSLQELGDVVEDPNIPQHARMQIWSVVSRLESK
ncbi:UPF0147 family protein [Candidatus Woesearchaeota archaeon]|nr:UPF0147 family protein [Candidatus Woesearchaeota archaeon]